MDLSSFHPVANKIVSLLRDNNILFETFTHEPVRTSEEAAKVRSGYSLKQGAKALILRIKNTHSDKRFIMLVLPGDTQFDKKKVKQFTGAKDIRFATVEEVDKLTSGVQPGGVPPFGNLFGLPVYMDAQLLLEEKIIFNAGDKRFSVAMKTADAQNLIQAKVVQMI